MSGFQFPGGIESIDIDDAGDFDTGLGSSFVVTIGRASINKDGTEFPDPEVLTAELADDREGRLGLDQSFDIAAKDMQMSDFETLEDEALKHTDLHVRVISQATGGSGNPLWKVIYHPVILSDAKISPVNVERESKGAFMFSGMVTGYRFADLGSVTLNSI